MQKKERIKREEARKKEKEIEIGSPMVIRSATRCITHRTLRVRLRCFFFSVYFLCATINAAPNSQYISANEQASEQ